MSERKRIGFHISLDDGALRNNDPRSPVEEASGGFVRESVHYRTSKTPKMCKQGFHASWSLRDATLYRFLKAGRVISMVEVWGDAQEDSTKFVGRNRRVLASFVLHERDLPKTKTIKIPTGYSIAEIDAIPAAWFKKMEDRLAARAKLLNRNRKWRVEDVDKRAGWEAPRRRPPAAFDRSLVLE